MEIARVLDNKGVLPGSSDLWLDSFVKSLQDTEEAIACLEVLLEETEEDPAVHDCAFIPHIPQVLTYSEVF